MTGPDLLRSPTYRMNLSTVGARTQTVSASVFLFYALTLTAPSGYSYGSGALLLASILFLASRPKLRADKQDRTIICLFAAFFLASVWALVVHAERLNTLDQASRALFAIPILLLLLQTPPKLTFMWAGLTCGSVAAAGLAFWQVHYVELGSRADGFVTSAIPFGNIGLMMAVLCASGIFWASTQGKKARLWRAVLFIGTLAGLYCSFASGSRGGWLILPIVTLLFITGFVERKNWRKSVGIIVIGALTFTCVFSMPDSNIRARFNEAVHEVNRYFTHHESASSVGARLETWKAATLLIAEKPFLGWSHNAYREELSRRVASKTLHPFVTELSNTHNNFIEVWLFQGLLGLLSLVAMFVIPFFLFCRRLRSSDTIVRVLAVSGSCLVASFFIFGITHVILGRNNGIVFFVMTLIVLWSCMRNRENVIASSTELMHG